MLCSLVATVRFSFSPAVVLYALGTTGSVVLLAVWSRTSTEVVNALAPDASHPGKIKPRRDIADETITHVPGRGGQSDITLHEYMPDIWVFI